MALERNAYVGTTTKAVPTDLEYYKNLSLSELYWWKDIISTAIYMNIILGSQEDLLKAYRIILEVRDEFQ